MAGTNQEEGAPATPCGMQSHIYSTALEAQHSGHVNGVRMHGKLWESREKKGKDAESVAATEDVDNLADARDRNVWEFCKIMQFMIFHRKTEPATCLGYHDQETEPLGCGMLD